MKRTKGITLIALIITIIVLLILAGVALNTLFGEGSIIGNAQNAISEYNKKVEEEQLALKELEEYLKSNGINETGILQLVEKGEDWIKVKVEGQNYEDYQFSIDNGEYILSNTNEYTFNNLEVTTVTKALEAEEGKSHLIKARAKNKQTSKIEELNNITIATDVLVVSDQVEYFKYEESEKEITITELVPFSEIVTEPLNYNSWDEFFNNLQETIVVPSYINNKPVTKISNKFIRQVANIGTYAELEPEKMIAWIENKLYFNLSSCQTNESFTYSAPTDSQQATIISIAGNQIGMGTANYENNDITINMNVQNGIVKNGIVKIILPPTINQIMIEKVAIKNIVRDMRNLKLGIPDTKASDSLLDGGDLVMPKPLIVKSIYAVENQNVNNTTILMLGQNSQERQNLKNQIEIDWDTFTQVKVRE